MSLINSTRRLYCIISLMFCLLFVGTAAADNIKVMGEYHPPLNGNPDDASPGFMIEIAQAVFSKYGHTVTYSMGPRPRAVKQAKMGQIDCVVNAKINTHNYLSFPDQPWGYHAATLFALPESKFQYQNIEQLVSITLGAIAGMGYDNGPLDDYLKHKSKMIVLSHGKHAMTQQMKMLFHKRIETVVSCPLIMRGQLKSMGVSLNKVKNVGEVKPLVGMYFACGDNARTDSFIDQINKTIPLMRKSGELQEILDKYGQIDWIDIYNSQDTPH
ncbi:MAG: transporter substrate-binding domain-containing protein [Oceanospirillaceae bacterium]